MQQYRYENFSHSYLTGDQLSSLATVIHVEMADSFPEDLFVSTENNKLKEENDRYSALKSRGKGGDLSKRTQLSDRKRKLLLSKIKRRIKDDIDMEEFYPDPAKKAKAINEVIKLNPVNHEISYEEETAQLNRIFDEMERAEVIEGSSVHDLWQKLKEEQLVFEALRQEKTSESAQYLVGEIREPIANMVYRLNGLLVYLDRKAGSDSTYVPAAQRVEEMIADVMVIGRARETRKEALAV